VGASTGHASASLDVVVWVGAGEPGALAATESTAASGLFGEHLGAHGVAHPLHRRGALPALEFHAVVSQPLHHVIERRDVGGCPEVDGKDRPPNVDRGAGTARIQVPCRRWTTPHTTDRKRLLRPVDAEVGEGAGVEGARAVGAQAVPAGRGDHRCVVGAHRAARQETADAVGDAGVEQPLTQQ
jgi:hypothetical protein